LSKNNLISIAGGLWGIIGIFLIYRGIGMYQIAVDEQNSTQMAVLYSVSIGIVVGFFKGLFVLSKSARKNKSRIQNLEAPLKIHHIFAKPFYGLIAGMMLLGVLLRNMNGYLGGYIVVAGIYCGVGIALIVGSRVYWKTEVEVPVEENR
jgi:uncharacterized membrane protein